MICSRCRQTLEPGSVFWSLDIRLTAEQAMADPGENCGDSGIMDERLESLLERIRAEDVRSLENQVFQQFQFKLCRECRDIFTANPLNLELTPRKFTDDQ